MTRKIQVLLLVSCTAFILGVASTEYVSGQAGSNEAKSYTKVKNISSRYLAERDLDPWFAKLKGNAVLDYGSGLGFSTEFLLKKGFNVEAVDINQSMIDAAKQTYKDVNFSLVSDGQLPFADKTFDLVFSSLVLFELKNLDEIKQYIAESKRVLKDDGYFIGITGSEHMHNPDFKSVLRFVDFPENRHATSGSIVKVRLNEINLTFSDYLWFERDYRTAFAAAGLQICAVHYPLGKKGEDYPWMDEIVRSPLLLILAAKNCG